MIGRGIRVSPHVDRDAATTREGRWQPRHWRIRTKMAVVLLVPTITALTFCGLRIAAQSEAAGVLRDVVTQVDTARAVTGVTHQLQNERSLVTAGRADDRLARDQYGATDRAVTALRAALGELNPPSNASGERYDRASRALDRLTGLREDTGDLAPRVAFTEYSTMISGLNQLSYEISGTEGRSRTGAAAQALGRAKEHGARLEALLQIAGEGPGSAGNQGRARYEDAGFVSSIEDFKAVASPAQRARYAEEYRGSAIDEHRRLLDQALSTSDAGIDGASLTVTRVAANDALRDVETGLLDELRERTVARAGDAVGAAVRDGVIMLVALALTVLLMLRVAGWLINPLRRLHRGARDVASTTLPETVRQVLADPESARNAPRAAPVPVFSSDEIGDVARSIDAVQQQAVSMAAEQALLRDNVSSIFVNLSRRSQALIERQLSELDRLEAEDQDPVRRNRFLVLDHLAARLRRNSENLLVLSGAGLVRRSSAPMPVARVIGAAVSEIEDYPRVRARDLPEVSLLGRVVNDVVHLMAELLDNAVTFSPPDENVTVHAALTGSGALAVHITDSGMGLEDDELEVLNASLENPPEFDVSLSRRMGLYVVARLAQRHDIRVRLRRNEEVGATAVLTIPATLLAPADPDGAQPMTPDPPSTDQPEPSEVHDMTNREQPPSGSRAGTPPSAAPVTSDPALPKRTPRAQLPAEEDNSSPAPLGAAEFDVLPGTLRSAESLRDKLSGFQRGIAKARAISGNDHDGAQR